MARRLDARRRVGFLSFEDMARGTRGVGESSSGPCAYCLTPIRAGTYMRKEDCGHFVHSAAGTCQGRPTAANPEVNCLGRMSDNMLPHVCHRNHPADRAANAAWVRGGRQYHAVPDVRDRLRAEQDARDVGYEERRRARFAFSRESKSRALAMVRKMQKRIRDRDARR